MKKQDLIYKDLKGRPFVDDIENVKGGDELIHKNLNIKTYAVNILEVVDKVGIVRTVHIYVQNEGQPNERAFYMRKEPEQTVNKVA